MTLTAAKGNSLDFADGGGEPRVSKFSFNPAAKEFALSSMPYGPNAAMSPQARSRPQRIPEWKPSNKIRDERKKVSNKISPWIRNTPPTVTPSGGSNGSRASSPEPQKGSTPPQSNEEQPVPSEPSASPETLVKESKELLAAMINTGRANGKLEEVLAGMQPESEGSGDVVPARGDPGEATGNEQGEPMKDYPAVPITPFKDLINDKDEVSDPTPAWPGF